MHRSPEPAERRASRSNHARASRSAPRRTRRRRRGAALLGCTALVAAACAGTGGGLDSGGESTALYSLSEARAAQATASEAQQAVQAQSELTEATLDLAIATADLVDALAAEDPDRIAETSAALRVARQAAQRTATRVGADITTGAAAGDSGGAGTAVGPDTPGANVEVRMARATWNTGYMQAAVFRALLTELGYTVSDPSEAEMAPVDFYPALARGEYDFWANGWFPTHDSFLFPAAAESELPDGGVPGDYVSRVGTSMASGGLQGFLVDQKTADARGITSMADVAADPAPWDSDGDGRAEIAGCDDGWGCQLGIEEVIAANGWEDSVEQVSGDYSVLWDEQIDRLERGEPVLAYTWTPSAYIVELVPGRNAYWLAVPKAAPGQEGAAALPESQCPTQPCVMGFTAADIAVVANDAFLSANPAAAELLGLVTFDVLDIALQNVRYQGGATTEEDIAAHAAAWIADNREAVDAWLAEARAAR